MKFRHTTAQKGWISFALRQKAKIVDGVFEAPDNDPGLIERLKAAGHTPIEEGERPAPGETPGVEPTLPEPPDVEEETDGTPAPDEERPAGGNRGKKGR